MATEIGIGRERPSLPEVHGSVAVRGGVVRRFFAFAVWLLVQQLGVMWVGIIAAVMGAFSLWVMLGYKGERNLGS